jgi:hypothetical protein
MLLFKTAGDTFNSVVENEKHAFFRIPKDWQSGEIVLISKNKKDCRIGDKQIQYITFLKTLRSTSHSEIEGYWPGNFGRWKYIADCYGTKRLSKGFNLDDLFKGDIRVYKNITPAMKIHNNHEEKILSYLRSLEAL